MKYSHFLSFIFSAALALVRILSETNKKLYSVDIHLLALFPSNLSSVQLSRGCTSPFIQQ